MRLPRIAPHIAHILKLCEQRRRAPQNPWQPGEAGYGTKNVEWYVEGLPPAAAVRFQVCAIGAQVGPWSEDVLGKAR